MPVVTYVAPVGSDGLEVTNWSKKLDTFTVGVPTAHAGHLSPKDLPAIVVEGGWPHRSEYLFGASLTEGSLSNIKAQFTAEETEHKQAGDELANALAWLRSENHPALGSPDQSKNIVTILRTLVGGL
jgi:hypothetical protein